jgi:hypothetical protein
MSAPQISSSPLSNWDAFQTALNSPTIPLDIAKPGTRRAIYSAQGQEPKAKRALKFDDLISESKK